MRILKTTVATMATSCALITSSNAVQYTFEYVFGSDGAVVSGSFEGTPNGNLIEDLSNVQVTYNHPSLAGPVDMETIQYAYGFSNLGGNSWTLGTAQASFDGTENNFVFTDSPNFPTTYTEFFYIIVPLENAYLLDDSPDVFSLDLRTYDPSAWTVAEARGVNTGGSSAHMLSGALICLSLCRAHRRRRQFRAKLR